MAALRNVILGNGKFAWQLLWIGGDVEGIGSTCPQPLVTKSKCVSELRALCQTDSPAQTPTMMYSFSPGSCSGSSGRWPSHRVPIDPPQLKEDLANFLLVRGPYAYLGHGWLGCNHEYVFPPELNEDFGEPTAVCSETAAGSGVFVREWTKASVQMDCNSYTPTITMREK